MKMKDLVLNYRCQNEISQEEMANKLGVSIVTMVSIEKGKDVSFLTKSKVANFFEMKLEDLE